MKLIQSNSETMSSREIADLVGSRHDDVKRTITRLAEREVIQLPPMADVKNHRKQTVSEYRVCKRDTYVIVAQLSPEFTGRLVDRCQELESMADQSELANRSRRTARLEAPQMTEAIKVIRADHDLDKSEPIRDHLTPCQIACVEHLQRVNTSLIEINMEFDQRKEQLNKVYLLRHKRALMAEVLRIEA